MRLGEKLIIALTLPRFLEKVNNKNFFTESNFRVLTKSLSMFIIASALKKGEFDAKG